MPHAAMSQIRRLANDLISDPSTPAEVRAAAVVIADAALIGWQLALNTAIEAGTPAEVALSRLRELAEAEGLTFEGKIGPSATTVTGQGSVVGDGMSLSERLATARLVLVGEPVRVADGSVRVSLQHRRFAIVQFIQELATTFADVTTSRRGEFVRRTSDGLLTLTGVRGDERIVDQALLACAGLAKGSKWTALAELCSNLGLEVEPESLRRMYLDEQARIRREHDSRGEPSPHR